MSIETISQAFLNMEKNHIKPDMFKVKKGGKYTDISTSQISAEVRAIAAGLKNIGVEHGDKIIFFSENRPEWVMTDLASLCQGAVPVPIYTSVMPDTVKYIINNSDARFVIVSGQALLDKVMAVRAELPKVEKVIAFDPVDSPGVMPFSELTEMGRVLDVKDPGAFEAAAMAVQPDDLASIVYTSGTTGVPKGVMLTHKNILSNSKALDAVADFGEKDTVLSFLPLSHVLERMCTLSFIYTGVSIAFAESVEKVADNLVEVRPTMMISVPRLFDKFYARVMDKVLAQSRLKRKIFFWALKVGKRYGAKKMNEEPISAWLAWKRKIAHKLVLHSIVDATGGRVHYFVSGGAPLSKEVAEFFYAAGILLCEGYGLTECSPVLSFNGFDRYKLGTVGFPVPGVEIKIAEDGEILARGPNITQGYYKMEKETREAFEGGWFHTGDIGHLDEVGRLVVTDRKKDIIITSGGKNVAPQAIESMIKNNPYISNVVVVGAGRKFVSALVVPEFNKVEEFARSKGIAFADRKELVAGKEINDFLLDQINMATPTLASYERIKKIILFDRDFEEGLGEMTPTLKVRRKAVEEKFKSLIDTLYDN